METGRIDECFGQVDRVAMHVLHVGRQACQAEGQHPRGQVAGAPRPEQDIAGVVGNQMQAGELLVRGPADPAVADTDLEGPALPANQSQPAAVMDGNMMQGLAEKPLPGQVMMGPDQRIPAPLRIHAAHEVDLDLTKRNISL